MKQLAALLVTFFFCIYADAQKVYEFNSTCQQAYQEITKLKIASGLALVEKARQQNPDNLIPELLESYADFYILFLNEDPKEYQARYPKFSERIDLLEQGPKSSPFYYFCLSMVRVHKAASAIKFGKIWDAGWDFKKAYSLIKENKKQFPTFAPNDLVYGSLQADDPAFTEETPYAPNSPYSASKAAADHLVRAYHHTYGLPVVTTNCSNNYGPRQFPEKLIPLMIISALQGKPMPIYGDGLNIRDWLFVGDHCHALLEVIRRGQVGQTYNVGGGAERTNKEVVNDICHIIDERLIRDPRMKERFPSSPAARGGSSASLVTRVSDRPGHDRRYAINGNFLRQILEVVPREDFESGLRQTVFWYMENEPWWQQALSHDFGRWMECNYASR